MVTLKDFTAAINIYLEKPQVVNRRTGGGVMLYTTQTPSLSNDCVVQFITECTTCITDNTESISSSNTHAATAGVDVSEQLVGIILKYRSAESHGEIKLTCRKLISKQSHVTFPYELIVKGQSYCLFIPVELERTEMTDGEYVLTPVGISYTLMYDITASHSITLCLEDAHRQLETTTTSCMWLERILLARVIRWAETGCDNLTSTNTGTSNHSMTLVDLEIYYSRYTSMKDKYASHICKIWPECTDPLKFVYEDVAIACYIMCLWDEEREEKKQPSYQTFVDVGCGNGLLVYILTQEGYKGYGVDLRKRKIWDMFGDKADLREESVDPTSTNLYTNTDWLIGNHSDELTPWIPVMSARSSRACQFFLLPCCPFNFYSKYQRSDAAQSVYAEYLKFVCGVVDTCGFDHYRDSLRIPSTKKECIIGRRRPDMTSQQYNEADAAINDLVNSVRPSQQDSDAVMSSDQSAVSEFIPRSQVELVKNCATVSQTTQAHIVDTLTRQLLTVRNMKTDTQSGAQWNAGGTLKMFEVVRLFTDDVMKSLKAECGGLKTLLKNHHHIFTVLPGAVIRLADFSVDKRTESKLSVAQYKTKLCWFYASHPDGCVMSSDTCRYAHGEAQLRPKPHTQSPYDGTHHGGG